MNAKQLNLTAMLTLACAAWLIGAPQTAMAAVELNMAVQREMEVTDNKGNKTLKLVEPKIVVPGDTVVYTTSYFNNAKTLADNVLITNPIPKDTTYVDGSATGVNSAITYSVDGGKNFDLPEKLSVTATNGKHRPATAKDYTHIRWIIKSLSPQARGQVSFQTKIN